MTDPRNDLRHAPPPVRAMGRGARSVAACLALLACVLGVQPVLAHAPEQSYVFLRLGETRIAGSFEITVADANAVLGLGLPADRALVASDLAGSEEAIAAYLIEHARFAPDGEPASFTVEGFETFETSFANFIRVRFSLGPLTARPAFVDVEYDVFLDELPGHAGLLVISDDWESSTFGNEGIVSLTFSADERSQRLDLSEGSLWRGLAGMVELGAHHIAIGIDHVLFLLALLLPCVVVREEGRWQPVEHARTATWNVVKIVTLFTIAHSITLAMSALGVVELSSRLVESVIALSIAIAALDILMPVLGPRIGWVVFGFGLFHGVGFASVLGEVGVHEDYLVLTLLGFNVGVELGQLAIVAVVLPLLLLARRTGWYRRAVLPVGAAALIAMALYWFVERAFEVDLPAGAIVQDLLGLRT